MDQETWERFQNLQGRIDELEKQTEQQEKSLNAMNDAMNQHRINHD